MARRVGAKPHGLVSSYSSIKETSQDGSRERFGRYNGLSKPDARNPRFGYVRLGDMPSPAKTHVTRGKGWRFF
ncbi:hypothetical protein [Bacillus subtilis]|uniref:hypothetical protein n=1 Tax=Bacillus subtilis TaxID=1423 RepID=UPI001BCD6990|nr:hypothetical protein [Bacillus subtilis]